jgi:hypothetical protein
VHVYRSIHAAVLVDLEVFKPVWLRAPFYVGWGAASMGNRVPTFEGTYCLHLYRSGGTKTMSGPVPEIVIGALGF